MRRVVKKIAGEIRRSPARKRELVKLASKPDEAIDLSEMPELDEEFWKRAVRNPFYKPVKKQITLRLDADVIAWLRRGGKGYQTKANALLREVMVREIEKAG
jgi:uncharacterized protein (DUF4415 family)